MIQKVLAATINWDHPQKGQLTALRSMFPRVIDFDFLQLERQGLSHAQIGAQFEQTAERERPDWFWLQLQSAEHISAETLWRVRKKLPTAVLTHWMGDYRDPVAPSLAATCEATHLTLLSNVGQAALYQNAGAQDVRYCQIGIDWEEDALGIPEWTPPFRVPDVVFCGNLYTSERFPGTAQRLAMAVALRDAKIDFGIVGHGGWPKNLEPVGTCGVKQQHHVWKRAKVGVNANHTLTELYYSDRQLISMASGTPLVCHYVPGLEREFTDGKHLLWFKTPEECVDKVRWLLAHPEDAKRIGRAGRAKVLAEHTWWNRFAMVLPWVEEIQARLGHNTGCDS